MTADAQTAELAAYLDAVTAPFPEDSAARIRADLTGHVLDAAAPGEPDTAAIREALVALGPAAEVRAALSPQFFTRADLAWLEQDRHLRRVLSAGGPAPQPRPIWLSVLGVLLGAGLLTSVTCGWPGWPPPFGTRRFSWFIPAALLLELTLVEWGAHVLRQRPARSATVLRRVYGTLVGPGMFALNLPLLAPSISREPELLVASLGSYLAVAYLTRPRAALTLARKAWRGAR